MQLEATMKLPELHQVKLISCFREANGSVVRSSTIFARLVSFRSAHVISLKYELWRRLRLCQDCWNRTVAGGRGRLPVLLIPVLFERRNVARNTSNLSVHPASDKPVTRLHSDNLLLPLENVADDVSARFTIMPNLSASHTYEKSFQRRPSPNKWQGKGQCYIRTRM